MVSNMERHYAFKSLFEHNITHVSSIGGKAHLCTLSDIVHGFPRHIYRNSLNFLSDAILQFLYSVRSVSIDLLLQIAHPVVSHFEDMQSNSITCLDRP